MAQKITYCLVTSKFDEQADAYIDDWHKDKLYDLTEKADLKVLAVDAVNYLAQGFKLSLKTWIERDSLSFSSSDLGITQ